MMYHELRLAGIRCLSFMKDTDCVMYVGPELTPKELAHLNSIDISSPVIYLPELVKGVSKEMFEYNFPGVVWPGDISSAMICDHIIAELGQQQITHESRLILKYDGDTLVIFDAKDSFSLAVSYLINKCDRSVRFSASPRGIMDIWPLCEECCEISDYSVATDDDCSVATADDCSVATADDSFDDVMETAALEVRNSIRQLLLSGFSASVIRSWLDEEIKLSRLPKTVFLFFLRHPEGVRLSYLQDHVDELRMIYGHVSVNDDPQKMEASIAALVDPFNNSICEKCAAVKKAFILQIDDSIASNYYITGEQGKKKGILLDRSLVEWECEL